MRLRACAVVPFRESSCEWSFCLATVQSLLRYGLTYRSLLIPDRWSFEPSSGDLRQILHAPSYWTLARLYIARHARNTSR